MGPRRAFFVFVCEKEKPMNETLQEFVDSRGVAMRVDRDRGVIRGVKILGLASRNGRAYLPEALAQAAPLYEGAKVNVNHPKGSPAGPRDYQDRIGAIREVVVRNGEGLFADFHFNPKHALSEQLIWDAEHAPENVGFSHNVQAKTSRRGDRVVVEAITKVQSVDLVADPATTRGLFESIPAVAEAATEVVSDAVEEETGPNLAELTIDELKEHRADLVEVLLAEQAAEAARLTAEVDRLRTAQAVHTKRATVHRLLAEFQLPDPETATGWAKSVVSDHFLESLLAAPDEEAMRRLIEDRARLVRGTGGDARPQSREQSRLDASAPVDAKTFVQTIT